MLFSWWQLPIQAYCGTSVILQADSRAADLMNTTERFNQTHSTANLGQLGARRQSELQHWDKAVTFECKNMACFLYYPLGTKGKHQPHSMRLWMREKLVHVHTHMWQWFIHYNWYNILHWNMDPRIIEWVKTEWSQFLMWQDPRDTSLLTGKWLESSQMEHKSPQTVQNLAWKNESGK